MKTGRGAFRRIPSGERSGDFAYAGFFIDYKPRTARDDLDRRGDDSKKQSHNPLSLDGRGLG